MNLQFQTDLITVDFDLRHKLTVLSGDSGTGKTFIISQLKKFLLDGEATGKTTEELIGFKSAILLDYSSFPEDYALLSLPGPNLIVIDNCDYLMRRDPDILCNTIIEENHNWYILCGRYMPYLPMSDRNYAVPKIETATRTFTLNYTGRSL